MSEELNRPMDEQLKAWAQRRRADAGGPFELHPATRRILQDEVAHTYSPGLPPATPRLPWWHVLRWRLAMAAALAVVVVVALVEFLPGRTPRTYEFARNDRPTSTASEAKLRDRPAGPEPAPATPDSGALPRVTLTAPATSVESETAPGRTLAKTEQPAPTAPGAEELPGAAAARTPEAPATPSADLMRQRYGLASGSGSGPGVDRRPPVSRARAVAPPSSPPVPEVRVARAEEPTSAALAPTAGLAAAKPSGAVEVQRTDTFATRANASRVALLTPAGQSQQFTQVQRYRANFNSPPLPKVLQSFRLEQSGPSIRVVDADGSVYEGLMQTPEVPDADKAQEESRPGQLLEQAAPRDQLARYGRAMPGAGGQAMTASRFRVAGTNRISRLKVVFDGTLLTAPATQALGPGQGSQTADSNITVQVGSLAAQPASQQQQAALPTLRVQGHALIGDRTRLEIDAAPVAP